MIRELRKAALDRKSEDVGFTLIELLVVIIIIGILAAVAVPIFLSQRSQATDSAVKSDIRTVARGQESYFASESTYGTVAQILADGSDLAVSATVTVHIDSYDSQGYCLRGESTQSNETWYYDSQAGGLQDKGTAGCPVSTGGAYGDFVPIGGP